MTVFHFLVYLSLLIFTVAVIARVVRIARMPVHLRWELYPVPHEKGRAAYGGSILEEVNWWTIPRQVDHISEWRAMFMEIVLLKGVWEHNRSLWFPSWTLHFGLYLLCGEMGLAVVAGILIASGSTLGSGALLMNAITLLAWTDCSLGLIGCMALSGKRLRDPKLRMFNSPSHFFNLFLLGMMSLTGLIWVATNPDYARQIGALVAALFTLTAIPALPSIAYWNLGIVLFFLIYFPFTHMTHAFVKYFTYHDVRWEDTPNFPGGKMGIEIDKLEQQPVTWAAPHVRADGKKTWLDIVTDSGEEKKA